MFALLSLGFTLSLDNFRTSIVQGLSLIHI